MAQRIWAFLIIIFGGLLVPAWGIAQSNENEQFFNKLIGEGYIDKSWNSCGYTYGASRLRSNPKMISFESEIDRLRRAEGYGDIACYVSRNAKAAYLVGALKWIAAAEVTDSIAAAVIDDLKVDYLILPVHIYVSPADYMKVSVAIGKQKMRRVIDQGIPN